MLKYRKCEKEKVIGINKQIDNVIMFFLRLSKYVYTKESCH